MQYIIILLVVIELANADYTTGIVKAYCTSGLFSSKMRKGWLNRLCEIIVMTTSLVFTYIRPPRKLEIISIIEKYAEIKFDAQWTLKNIKHLINTDDKKCKLFVNIFQ